MMENNIHVKIESFDGPLGLLLHLIQKEEMEIKNLNLTKITEQYLNYLNRMQDLNFDIAGEYLYLASTLCFLKSRSCISEEETKKIGEEDDSLKITSHSELIEKLEQLQHFQNLANSLWSLPKKGHDIFTRPKINRNKIVNSILTPIDLEKLTGSMMDFLFRESRKFATVKRDRLSIKEKLVFLKNYLKEGVSTDFFDLLQKDFKNKEEEIDNIVITFISLLELARLKRVTLFQNEPFQNIYVKVVKSLEDFDINAADGFDDPIEENVPSLLTEESSTIGGIQ